MTAIARPITDKNFRHLVHDLAWFGLALAATTRFTQFYAIRLGATPMDVAWITSLPAIVLIFSTTLTGWWRKRHDSIVQANILPALGFRLIFLLPAFAPYFPAEFRPLWIILSATLPAVLQGMGSTLFILLMRSGVEPDRLTPLLSRRALVMNISISLGAVGFGFMLEAMPFPLNYQVMYIFAFGFSLVSAWHVFQIKEYRPIKQIWKPTEPFSLRELMSRPGFQSVTFVTVISHIAFFALFAVIPLHLENHLGASEGFIGIYGLAELAAGAVTAFTADRIVAKIGNRAFVAWAMVAAAAAAFIIALAPALWLTLLSAIFTGAAWTAIMIGTLGFFAERTTDDDIHATNVFHQMIFLAMFIGPMLGTLPLDFGVTTTGLLLAGGLLRIAAALLTQAGLKSLLPHRKAIKMFQKR